MVQYPNPVVQQMVLTYDAGTTAIQIGPGPSITFYNASGTQVASFTGTIASWGTPTNPGITIDASNPFVSVLAFPTNDVGEVIPAKFQSDVFGAGPSRQYRTIFSTARLANGGPTDTFIHIWNISQAVNNSVTPLIDFRYTGPTSQNRLMVVQPGRNGAPVLIGNNQVWQQLTLLNGWVADTQAGIRNGLWVIYMPDGMARIEGRLVAPAAPVGGQLIAQLPTNAGYPTIPTNTIQVLCQCTGNASSTTSIDIVRHNAAGNSACVQHGGFPASIGANGVLVVGHTFYVGDGTLS